LATGLSMAGGAVRDEPASRAIYGHPRWCLVDPSCRFPARFPCTRILFAGKKDRPEELGRWKISIADTTPRVVNNRRNIPSFRTQRRNHVKIKPSHAMMMITPTAVYTSVRLW